VADAPKAEFQAPGRPERRSAWPTLLTALCLSIPLHLALALWLSGILVFTPSPVRQAVLVESALPGAESAGPEEVDPGPTQMPSMPVSTPTAAEPEARWSSEPSADALLDPALQGDASSSGDPVGAAAPGAVVLGSGGGTGGVATTTFFGARGTGRRFAFIVDKSGSMARQDGGGPTRMQTALEELRRATDALPDFVQYRVCLFDTSLLVHPERGFAKAREGERARLARWLDGTVPVGGTTPQVAFDRVLGEGVPPDAIFFLTDGRIPAEDPDWIVKRAKVRGRMVPVHCVVFGDEAAARQLEPVSVATGGEFRFVPIRGVAP
jgi:hypothetical protein